MLHANDFRLTFAVIFLVLFASPLWGQPAADPYRFENVERVVAIGDVHGARDELVEILKATDLVDDDLSWIGGKTHLVSVGDLVHRGDHGRQVMDLLMRLEGEASKAGGAVHVVLGNHDVMAMTGDFRYVSDAGFSQFGTEPIDGLPPGFVERRRAFAPDGRYGRWLLNKPVMIVIDDSLFVHGGLPEILKGMSLEEINKSAQRDVSRFANGWQLLLKEDVLDGGDDFDAIRERAAELTGDMRQEPEVRTAAIDIVKSLEGLPFLPDGPLWYRGTSACHPYTEKDITTGVLESLGAARVVIGHTPTVNRRITSRMDERVYRIDTGMNREVYRGRPSALVIMPGRVFTVYSDDEMQSVRAEPNRVWSRPDGMSDEQIEEFLLSAEVTKTEDIGEGVTKSKRLTLELDGRSMRALFKTIDTDPGLERKRRWQRESDFADRYMYEIAAYRLDRLLDLQMVPVTVDRTVDGVRGSVQYWIEDSFNEARRREEEISVHAGLCGLQPQYTIMNVFDVLIFNVDRNLGDILYDRAWNLWLVDHSRAFSARRGVPEMINEEIVVPPELARILKRVTRERLEELEPLLHERQLQALVSRAKWLRSRN